MLAVMLGWTNSLQLAGDLCRSRGPVLGSSYTGYLERQACIVSRGERTVRVASTTLVAPLKRCGKAIVLQSDHKEISIFNWDRRSHGSHSSVKPRVATIGEYQLGRVADNGVP